MDRSRWSDCTAGQMDREAGGWTSSGKIGLPPLARVKGVDRKQQDIIHYVHNQPGIIVRTDVIHGRIRDENNNMLTQFLICDKCVYVICNFSPVLHSLANLNSSKCRILHTSPKNACMRCIHLNHSTTDIVRCEVYLNHQNVLIVKSPKYPMSNYFSCRMKMLIDFPSSEHAYQLRFLRYIDMTDLANEVLKAPIAAEEKIHSVTCA